MAEWIYEAGIGEARAALVEGGVIRIARIEPGDGAHRVGAVVAARLGERTLGGAIVRLEGGGEALLAQIPAGLSRGAALMVTIVREAIVEPGRDKRAKAIVAPPGAIEAPGPDLLARISDGDAPIRRLHAHEPDALEEAGWSEVLEEARIGEIAFAGGALRVSPTPAMTLIDVDGQPPLDALAVRAATAAGAAILRHGIGGSIGIDFPTLAGRGPRQAVGAAIDAALPAPFERTAMNGFGFLQIVRRRSRASLIERLRDDSLGASVRALLRQIERTPPPGDRLYHLPRAELALLRTHPDWTAELTRRTGRATAFVAATEER